MSKRELPIGVQSFQDLRSRGCLYVDKTRLIYELASRGKVYFLSRPRRFGKSLLISTLDAYLSGRKELFEGLAIEKLEEENPTGEKGAWTKSPVIRLDFSIGKYDSIESLQSTIDAKLSAYEDIWGKKPSNQTFSDRFYGIIEQAHERTGLKAVVLVDEYDKPLLETMDEGQEELNALMRKELKSLYGTLKGADDYTRFVLITGVTKFSHVSIFSDLNQLNDISLDAEYNEICGMTLDEIKAAFSPEIDNLAKSNEVTRDAAIARLTAKYDGYCFSDPKKAGKGIYNPFSVLNCFAKNDYRSFWFATGTPTFLIKTMEGKRFDPQRMLCGVNEKSSVFTDYRIDSATPIPLFYQSGYLTIKDYDPALDRYRLEVPNDEVKYGLVENFLPPYAGIENGSGVSVEDFVAELSEGDTDAFMQSLSSLISSIPYDETRSSDKQYTYEYTYKVAVFLIFTLCGQYIRSEVHTLKGRCDSVCETNDHVFIFEFKMADAPDGTADEALSQIEKMGYAEPYKASGKEIIKLGVVFDSKQRAITEWKAETIV